MGSVWRRLLGCLVKTSCGTDERSNTCTWIYHQHHQTRLVPSASTQKINLDFFFYVWWEEEGKIKTELEVESSSSSYLFRQPSACWFLFCLNFHDSEGAIQSRLLQWILFSYTRWFKSCSESVSAHRRLNRWLESEKAVLSDWWFFICSLILSRKTLINTNSPTKCDSLQFPRNTWVILTEVFSQSWQFMLKLFSSVSLNSGLYVTSVWT